MEKKKETVNHPDHYNVGKIEIIDFIKDLGIAEDVSIGNAIKYISRYKHKENPKDDIKKAIWYLNYLLDLLEQENNQWKKENKDKSV